MISIVFCTREHNQKHIDHLKKMAGHPKVEVIQYINNGESLTKAYNKLLDKAKFDIVVFCHDDIEVRTKQMAKKIKRHYDKTDYGILGVAGTKYLHSNGKWWTDPKSMYGRVWHSHKGKQWESKYSEDLNKGVEDVVTVDGVFFSVMKSRLEKRFNEDVEGFHFYDIDFCFRNFLDGVKVGVHTDISITHMSIGETNNEWEENRKNFAEEYKDKLPMKIDREFSDNHSFNILFSCINFNSYTGSELYRYELAKALVKKGHNVTICSNIGGKLAQQALTHGIKLVDISEPLGFKRGDGKWQIQGNDGKLTPSEANKLYRVGQVNIDIIHSSHTPVTKLMAKIYPEIPIVSSIHSEVISLEHPVLSDNVKKYIAIRPEIKEYIIKEHDIPEEKIEIIYSPIDETRFKPVEVDSKTDKKITLFVGTIDYLRKDMLLDLIKRTKEENGELWVIGKENGINFDDIANGQDHVLYLGIQSNVEKYMNMADETAGILLGRTTIEGWMCGKGGWIYDVDNKGKIKGKSFHEVPEDIDKFKSGEVADKILEEYKEVLK